MGKVLARQMVFALNCYIAVILALFVAFSLDLPNPWWAMLTVFLGQPPQPLVGAIWAKAFYRTVGTAIGLVASLMMIPTLSGSTELLVLALATWVGMCLYLSLLDRTPRGYIFMLAGYTVALVGLPAAVNPTTIFDSAVARGEEIVIGVLSISIVHSIFLPRSVTSALQAKLDGILVAARTWVSDSLRTLSVTSASSISWRAASDLTELNLLASNLKFEGEFNVAGRRVLRALEDRIVTLLPLTSAVEDRLKALQGDPVSIAKLAPLIERVASWIANAHTPACENADKLVDDVNAIAPDLRPESPWSDLLLTSVTGRLTELVRSWGECLQLSAALHDPDKQNMRIVRPLLHATKPRALHVDHGIAALSGIVAGLTILALSAFTVAVHWETGSLAIGIAAVLCSLFATADDPTPLARSMITWLVLAFPVAVLYEFFILPAIDGFAPLAIVLFPVIFTIGYFFAQPKYLLKSLSMAVGFSAGLSLQPEFISSFPVFMNAYVALLVGAAFGLMGLNLARALPAQAIIQRILRKSWNELAALTVARAIPDRAVWGGRMLDRVGLLLPRLASALPENEHKLVETLNDLRLGVNIINLRHVPPDPQHAAQFQIADILRDLNIYFKDRASGRKSAPPTDLIAALDAVIAAVLQMGIAQDRHDGVVAAVGLRRSLFPAAPAYQPMEGVA